ncbi:hypothetical protein C9374_011440 [Naegleria lovaniensis]|uniref:EGF-like domain-containing protein n=1 Tax=Naegleria lovaniensis TaxID=51637 RepID=A0AA88H0P8_NAELO|nr:uncharacterized protein C9374_011440 [Naegleria lovaniensis]KAG2392715.1 hypothetical protein C9374_011440 [Naegleria lovaniensis]
MWWLVCVGMMVCAAPTKIALFGGSSLAGDNYNATLANMEPVSVSFTSQGDLIIADSFNQRIRKVFASNGTISTLAFDLKDLRCVHVRQATGEIFFTHEHYVKKLTTDNKIELVAGAYFEGESSSGTPARASLLSRPDQVWVHINGEIYIADTGNHRIKKIALDGNLYYVAGINNNSVYSGPQGDGFSAIHAVMLAPTGVSVSPSTGIIYIADTGNGIIRRIGLDGIITTVANRTQLLTGPYVAKQSNPVNAIPTHLHAQDDNNIYFTDIAYAQLKKMNSKGQVTLIAGTGEIGYRIESDQNGIQAVHAKLYKPVGISLHAGNIYVADVNDFVVRRVAAADGTLQIVAGNRERNFFGEQIPSTDVVFGVGPSRKLRLFIGTNGFMYVGDSELQRIRTISMSTKIVNTIAGVGPTRTGLYSNNVQALKAGISEPLGMVLNSQGELIVAMNGALEVKKLGLNGNLTSLAGGGQDDMYYYKNCQASNAIFFQVYDIAYIPNGDLIILDYYGAIRRLNGSGWVDYLVGRSPDETYTPILSDAEYMVSNGNEIYIADTGNHVVRTFNVTSQTFTTLAGTLNSQGFGGDGSLASKALLNRPTSLAMSFITRELYILDSGNFRIRKVNLTSGIISTVVGNGSPGVSKIGAFPNSTWINSEEMTIAIHPTTGVLYYSEGQFIKYLSDNIVCFGIEATSPIVCNGHGNCLQDDVCSCHLNWEGSTCSIPQCNRTSPTSPNVCNGRGVCIGLDTCKCNDSWQGQFCQNPITPPPPPPVNSPHTCNGTLYNSTHVCNGNGNCTYKDKCQCNEGYSGLFCERYNKGYDRVTICMVGDLTCEVFVGIVIGSVSCVLISVVAIVCTIMLIICSIRRKRGRHVFKKRKHPALPNIELESSRSQLNV